MIYRHFSPPPPTSNRVNNPLANKAKAIFSSSIKTLDLTIKSKIPDINSDQDNICGDSFLKNCLDSVQIQLAYTPDLILRLSNLTK